jgi:negative regulator of sigma E activity
VKKGKDSKAAAAAAAAANQGVRSIERVKSEPEGKDRGVLGTALKKNRAQQQSSVSTTASSSTVRRNNSTATLNITTSYF